VEAPALHDAALLPPGRFITGVRGIIAAANERCSSAGETRATQGEPVNLTDELERAHARRISFAARRSFGRGTSTA